MNFRETGFRAVYHNFCVVEATDRVREIMGDLPGANIANAVLAYGYYDRDAGLTLEVLAAAHVGDDGLKYAAGNDEVSLKLRIDAVEEARLGVCPDEDGKMAETFAEKLEILKTYDASEDIEETRKMDFLDSCRDPYFIDDVMVRLMKDDLQPEDCWVRITGLGDHYFVGTLLNEPYQDYGRHEGETIAFCIHRTEEGEIFCYADMNPPARVTAEDLADGSMLRDAVRKFNADRNEANLYDVLMILRDSQVWVPCTAVFSEEDDARFKKMMEQKEDNVEDLVGEQFTAHDPVRLIPDILQNGEKYFFPVFSSAEEMGDYGDDFSKVQKHILEVIPLARNNEKNVAGIVLNAFSDPFVLDAGLFDMIEGMKSRIETA